MTERLALRIVAVLLVFSLCVNVWLLVENRRLYSEWEPQTAQLLQVHVLGEVASPGVYTLPQGARVSDALAAAGGLTAQAEPHLLNLAKPLFDGEQIILPAKAAETAGMSGAQSSSNLVNINTASQAELETLPGIGPVKAAAIIAYRQQHGAFAQPADLMRVSGIGQKTFDQLKEWVTVK